MDQVEEVKSRLEIAEVIGTYVQLKQSGRNLKAACPFHSEKTASFMVSPEKGIWHCFGCGEGGDVIKFVQKIEGLEFRATLEMLARKAGVELKSSREDSAASGLKKRLIEANNWAVKYFQASLMKNPKALEYLIKQRGLKRETVKDFQIGYAPDTWEGLTKILTSKGFSEKELLAAGLVGKKRGIFDMFRGRLMLPICDSTGSPVGFTGRVLGDELPKYLNTPASLVYDKSRVIYGLHLAKEAIRSSDEAVIVEGNMDVVASHQAGVKNVVAVSGTALTLDQLKSLSKFTGNIKLALDQDAAGLAATERAIDLGQKLGLTLKMVTLAGAKDPDELIKKDPKQWQGAIADAAYIMDYLFSRFEGDYDLKSAVGKRQFSDRVIPNLRRLADPIEQDHYIKLLAEKTGTEIEQVRKKVDQKNESPATSVQAGQPQTQIIPTSAIGGRVAIEESLLALNLVYPEVRISLSDLKESDFSSPERQRIFIALAQAGESKFEQILKTLSKEPLDLPDLTDYVKILSLRGEEQFGSLSPADHSFESFVLSGRLQNVARRNSQTEISHRLKQAEVAGDKALVKKLLEEYQALMTKEQ